MKKSNNNRPRKKLIRQKKAKNLRSGPMSSIRSASFVKDINLRPKQSRFIRYQFTGTFFSVTRQFMLDSVLAVNATAAHRIFESVRLIHVRAYVMANQTLDDAQFSLTWDGDRGPDVQFNTEATIGIPGEIYSEPPEDTLAGFWSTDGTDESENLFTITCTSGGTYYIDLYFEYVLADGPATTGTANSSKTAGIYYLRDGSFIPVTLNNVVLT